MHILVIRLSALGDIVHSLPALTDLRRHLPEAQIDFAVDERFVELAQMHSHVDRVISLPLKRWKRNLAKTSTWQELRQTLRMLGSVHYDQVIDVHGVHKSAIVAWLTRTHLRSGPHPRYSVGWITSKIYQQHCNPPSWTPRTQWVRHIVGQAIGQPVEGPADFGLSMKWQGQASNTVAMVVNTAGSERLWVNAQWIELGRHLASRGLRMLFPWGNAAERQRAMDLVSAIGESHCDLGPTQSISEWALTLSQCRAVVGVDTGLLHIAAAAGVPCLGIFTTSSPELLISQQQHWVLTVGGPKQTPAIASQVCPAIDQLLSASAPSKT